MQDASGPKRHLHFHALILAACLALLPGAPYSALANPSTQGFVHIPAGEFQMGATNDPVDDECCPHKVTITTDFYLKQTEVTRGEWVDVMGTRPWLDDNGQPKANTVVDPDPAQDDLYPVTWVAWQDAIDYCVALNAREGGNWFRLPTEAEWEYAARVGSNGDGLLYSVGINENNLVDYAWYRENTVDLDPANAHPYTVGQKLPTSWGAGTQNKLYDIHGNVAEWVQDWYVDAYGTASRIDPAGPCAAVYSESKITRGGSWASRSNFPPVDDCRSANRAAIPAVISNSTIGFRVVLVTYPYSSLPCDRTASQNTVAASSDDGGSGGGGCLIRSLP